MVGNIVHNLRSALDILVFELAVRHQASMPGGLPAPIEPLRTDSPWRRTQFPIYTDEGKWNSGWRGSLGLIDPALVAEFRDLQPWYAA